MATVLVPEPEEELSIMRVVDCVVDVVVVDVVVAVAPVVVDVEVDVVEGVYTQLNVVTSSC
jgi:hypothetical protein